MVTNRVLKPFQYNGKVLKQGDIEDLTNTRNYQALKRLRYIVDIDVEEAQNSVPTKTKKGDKK